MDRPDAGSDVDPWRIGWTLPPGPAGPVVHRPDAAGPARGLCGVRLDRWAPVHDPDESIPAEMDVCTVCRSRHGALQAAAWNGEHARMRAQEREAARRQSALSAVRRVVSGGLPGLGRRR